MMDTHMHTHTHTHVYADKSHDNYDGSKLECTVK
jgi:hypothetical protein